MITQELLDGLWDFGDPAGSERRFAAEAASQAHTEAERAELLTQRARALGLQERFTAAGALLESLGQVADAAVRTRVRLETGRLLNSAGNKDEAVVEFEDAAALAGSGGLLFLEIDALHMLAIADTARFRERAAEAIDRALTAPEDRTRRWLARLLLLRGRRPRSGAGSVPAGEGVGGAARHRPAAGMGTRGSRRVRRGAAGARCPVSPASAGPGPSCIPDRPAFPPLSWTCRC